MVAFLTGQQRCHVLDENWNHVASYPEDALKNPHSGIADVQLGDLDGDGKLKMYVSYLGVVGVQAASLDGKRLWANRSISNVAAWPSAPPTRRATAALFAPTINGALVVLDAEGQRHGEIQVPAPDAASGSSPPTCAATANRCGAA